MHTLTSNPLPRGSRTQNVCVFYVWIRFVGILVGAPLGVFLFVWFGSVR